MNDLPWIKYDARRMYLDMMGVSVYTERAHRRLFDYTIFNDGPPLNDNDVLRQITGIEAANWAKTKGELMGKGWLETAKFFLHRGTIESLNESKIMFVSNHNQTAAANKKPRMEYFVRNQETGVLDIREICVTPPVTPPVTPRQSKSDSELTGGKESERQYSQSSGKHSTRPELTKLTIEKSSLSRICGEILANKHAWQYDNCKVKCSMFPFRKSLETVLEPFIGRIMELKVHAAWREAVTRAHGAVMDGLAENPARYTIQCWKEALGKNANE